MKQKLDIMFPNSKTLVTTALMDGYRLYVRDKYNFKIINHPVSP